MMSIERIMNFVSYRSFSFFFMNHEIKILTFLDKPDVFKDAPISIQLIGRTLEEEAVIRMGEIVDNALKTRRIQGPKL